MATYLTDCTSHRSSEKTTANTAIRAGEHSPDQSHGIAAANRRPPKQNHAPTARLTEEGDAGDDRLAEIKYRGLKATNGRKRPVSPASLRANAQTPSWESVEQPAKRERILLSIVGAVARQQSAGRNVKRKNSSN